jgi:hypothetical protein
MKTTQRVYVTGIALLAGLILATTSAATRARPSLSLRGTAPIVVSGRQFASHERVRITWRAGAAASLRASAAGAFTATLPMIPPDRCRGLRLRAAGSRGNVAVLKLPLPACLRERARSTA